MIANLNKEITDWANLCNVTLTEKARDELRCLMSEREDEAAKSKYDEGYDDGKADAEHVEPDTSWVNDLGTGLTLLRSDPAAAKVYLERCTKHADRYLIEVLQPCLL